ncbi:MAG: phosphotransferase [Pseudomonadota bacterium]
MADFATFSGLVEQAFPGATVISAELLTGGVSAQVYRLDLRHLDGSKGRVVLRTLGDAYTRHNAELEFALLNSLYRLGLPVPKPLFVDATCKWLDRPNLFMSFVDGTTEPPETGMDRYIDEMAENLALVHRTEVGVLPELPKRLDPLEELFDFLPKGPEWDTLREYLSALKDTEFTGTSKLLHGDFWPGNLILANNRIAAVLDWEDAAIGDPLSDVACTCLELRYIYGTKGMECFQQAYSRHKSIEGDRLALWLIYVAAAAQKYMSDWNLSPSREAHMRRTAIQTITESANYLRSSDANGWLS